MGSSPPNPLLHPSIVPRPRTSREASSLSSSLGKSREGREGAQAICGTQKVAQQQQEQQDGEEQWSGKLVKRFFSPAYSSICWPGTGPTSRQSGKFLSAACHSHIFQQSQTSKPQTRVNSDPSEPSVGLFIKMMRLAWQLGWWTHICTALFTPQRRQLKHRAKRSSRSNAFVVIGSNIEMPSWK